jgi:hypothetical protein
MDMADLPVDDDAGLDGEEHPEVLDVEQRAGAAAIPVAGSGPLLWRCRLRHEATGSGLASPI